MKDKKPFFLGCIIAFLIAFFDLFTKKLVFQMLESDKYSGNFIEITSFFNLVSVWNNGVSFGMFNSYEHSKIIFSIIVAVILLILLFWLYRNQDKYIAIALSFIIGGALGNLYDRVQNGAVADFLDFHIGIYHWPAFNIADSFVFVGVAMLLIDDIILKRK